MKKGYKLADGTYSTDYQEGGKFVVVATKDSTGKVDLGSVVSLIENDNSRFPYFSNDEGFVVCCSWDDLKKFNKEEIDVNTLQKQIEEMKQRIAEMEALVSNQQEKVEVKQWQPIGGEWWVDSEGDVLAGMSIDETRQFGMERPTKEQAEKARDEMRVYHRLLAYVHEHAPDYEYNPDDDNYYIENNLDEGVGYYRIDWDCNYKRVGLVYMPEDVAEELCRKLNSGEVVL